MNEADVKTYKIAGGFVAYTWVDGQHINGRGNSEKGAFADLQANLELDRKLRARCLQARVAAQHGNL
jgi:hypothetical protein